MKISLRPVASAKRSFCHISCQSPAGTLSRVCLLLHSSFFNLNNFMTLEIVNRYPTASTSTLISSLKRRYWTLMRLSIRTGHYWTPETSTLVSVSCLVWIRDKPKTVGGDLLPLCLQREPSERARLTKLSQTIRHQGCVFVRFLSPARRRQSGGLKCHYYLLQEATWYIAVESPCASVCVPAAFPYVTFASPLPRGCQYQESRSVLGNVSPLRDVSLCRSFVQTHTHTQFDLYPAVAVAARPFG